MGKPFQEGGCYGSSGRYFYRYFLLPRPTLPFPSAEVMVAFKQIVPIYLGAFFPLLLSPPVASPRFSSGPTNQHTWISGEKRGQKRQEEGRQDKSGGIELQIGKGGGTTRQGAPNFQLFAKQNKTGRKRHSLHFGKKIARATTEEKWPLPSYGPLSFPSNPLPSSFPSPLPHGTPKAKGEEEEDGGGSVPVYQ